MFQQYKPVFLRVSWCIMFTGMFTTTWLMPWYAGFMMILVALSGSYLWTGAGAAVTFAMALYGQGINGWPNVVFPIMMLVIAIALVTGLALRGRGATVGAKLSETS